MASFHYLNNHPNPFWDLLGNLEDHPAFAPRGQPHPHRHHPPPFWAWGHPQNEGASSEPANSYTAGERNEPQAGPSKSKEAHQDTNKEKARSSEPESSGEEQGWHGHCGKGKHSGSGSHPHGLGKERGGKGRHGCHPRGFHGHPFGGPRPHHRGPPPFAAGPGFPDFDFLRNIAAEFGFPFPEPKKDGVDFVPSVDVFDTPAKYIVHVSLPGAKKEDLSIDYDTEESVLRLAGVVYRPGINEDLHLALAVEERVREIGVFEREVRIGTRKNSAAIIVDEITANLKDGVLSVALPKVQKDPETKTKKVVVEDGNTGNEKGAMDVDESASETMTPERSESSDAEGEAKEYVNVTAQ
ncbi:hypothetical protein NUU61_006255 [Penicillium alfredii]|uniref:SHSP domain-containing protein n=1 Tax=Penicillium alfredii TaxID=1506179 RepID=A0A9W9F0K1_9EURO|nr:uncharacterized protein NUU61_006255 [Penicillium alfredii]KAJ5091385.1 hypothetical protein NUU61_006255 [Penicillium alfredii]